ncbi:cytochrome P450 [Nocardia sp. NBC_01327]|uniref:cytochrome P450 n=1 Tax=Nocardia sp. NBC_01327 TaxID=2903593 RepID=UPI002E105228|nr:cytochrome P450 [Nocardia sp. NBC_01327]
MTDVNTCPVDHTQFAALAGAGESAPIPGTHDRYGVATAVNTKRNGLLHVVEQLWREHGDISELQVGSRRIVVLAHPDHVRMVTLEQMDKYTKGASYDPVRKYWMGDGVATSVGAQWKSQRQVLAPFFTPKSVREYVPLFFDDVRWFSARWTPDSMGSEPVDMVPEMATLTASILLKTLFSTAGRDVIAQLKGAVETMIRYTSGRNTDRFKAPEWFPTAGRRDYDEARKRVDDFILGVIAERRRMPVEERPADLLTKMIVNEDKLGPADQVDQLLRDQCVTMFIAGYETTARTLAFVWYLLANNPEVAVKLRAEVDALPEDFTVEDLDRAPYSLGVIKESLRLHPPAPIYLRDVVEPVRIGPHVAPAGSIVVLAPYLTHRHPEFWTDPDKFDPERWAGGAERGMHPFAFHPFSAGPRVCIGRSFAYLESQILLVTLARLFAPERVPGYAPKWRMRGVLGPEGGMPMIIRRRAK